MTQEQKSQPKEGQTNQDPQQIQVLLKQTLKENKSLQSKNTKLESKYIELFKQNKLLKQDRTTFVNFATSFFNDGEGNNLFQDPPTGQCNIEEMQKIGQQKVNGFIQKIQQLEKKISNMTEQLKEEAEKQTNIVKQKLKQEWEARMKSNKDKQNKESHLLQKQIDSLKKSNEHKAHEISDLKNTLEKRTQELSSISKQKFKMEHHLNDIRKKQISEELAPPKEPDQSKTLVDKNEYLSLKQQVQMLMAKRDELRRQLRRKQDQLQKEQKLNQSNQEQLVRLNHRQKEADQKFELIRQCSLEELETMILSYHNLQTQANEIVEEKMGNGVNHEAEPKLAKSESLQEQIKREYLKNMVTRYIKAETSGSFDQAMTLLQIIGRIVSLNHEQTQLLTQYIAKHKQWWYIKY